MSAESHKTESDIELLRRQADNLRGIVNARAHFFSLEFLELEEKRKDFIRSILRLVAKRAEIKELEKNQ